MSRVVRGNTYLHHNERGNSWGSIDKHFLGISLPKRGYVRIFLPNELITAISERIVCALTELKTIVVPYTMVVQC